jgi:hypothetical protein
MSPVAGITDVGMNALFKFIVPREMGNERPRSPDRRHSPRFGAQECIKSHWYCLDECTVEKTSYAPKGVRRNLSSDGATHS